MKDKGSVMAVPRDCHFHSGSKRVRRLCADDCWKHRVEFYKGKEGARFLRVGLVEWL